MVARTDLYTVRVQYRTVEALLLRDVRRQVARQAAAEVAAEEHLPGRRCCRRRRVAGPPLRRRVTSCRRRLVDNEVPAKLEALLGRFRQRGLIRGTFTKGPTSRSKYGSALRELSRWDRLAERKRMTPRAAL